MLDSSWHICFVGSSCFIYVNCIYLRILMSNTISYQMMFVSFNNTTTGVTCGACTANHEQFHFISAKYKQNIDNIIYIQWRRIWNSNKYKKHTCHRAVVNGENHRPIAGYWQVLSYNVVHLALIEIQAHNISGDRHWLHR
jgi:hypothetical protein